MEIIWYEPEQLGETVAVGVVINDTELEAARDKICRLEHAEQLAERESY